MSPTETVRVRDAFWCAVAVNVAASCMGLLVVMTGHGAAGFLISRLADVDRDAGGSGAELPPRGARKPRAAVDAVAKARKGRTACRGGPTLLWQGANALKDVNQNPRRWVDDSGRVCVIEGWHPSAPSSVGFNLKVDGDWLGTFGTLEGAATAATAVADPKGPDVVLRLCRDPRRPGRRSADSGLHVVRPDDQD